MEIDKDADIDYDYHYISYESTDDRVIPEINWEPSMRVEKARDELRLQRNSDKLRKVPS